MEKLKEKIDGLHEKYEINREILNRLSDQYDNSLDENLIPQNEETTKQIIDAMQKVRNQQKDYLVEITKLKEELNNKNFEKIMAESKKAVEALMEDDEPTVELQIEEDLEDTLDLSEISDVGDIKIVFDAQTGVYRIHSSNKTVPYLYVVQKELLEDKNINVLKQKEEYGKDIDLNLVNALDEYDKKYHSKLKDKYVTNTFEGKIIYDFRKFSSLNKEFLNSKHKKAMKKMAKNYAKKHKNCSVINFFNKKTAVLLGISITAGAAVSSMTPMKNNDNNYNKEKVSIESTTLEDLEKTDKLPEVITEDQTNRVVITENIIDNTKATTEKEKDVTEVTSEKKTKEIKDIEEKTEKLTEEEEIKEEKTITKVGNKLNLQNIDLYYTSLEPEPRGNTMNLNCDEFKINSISVTYGPEIVEIIKNDSISIEELKEKYEKEYGDELRICFNVDGIDKYGNTIYKNVGWIDYSDINNNINTNTNSNVKLK